MAKKLPKHQFPMLHQLPPVALAASKLTDADHNEAAWKAVLGDDISEEELTWLKGFHVTKNGNLSYAGYLHDGSTAGGLTLPFRLNVFSKANSEDKIEWLWGVVVNPVQTYSAVPEGDQVYTKRRYHSPFTAANHARGVLLHEGFTIMVGDPAIVGVRTAFKREAFKQGLI